MPLLADNLRKIAFNDFCELSAKDQLPFFIRQVFVLLGKLAKCGSCLPSVVAKRPLWHTIRAVWRGESSDQVIAWRILSRILELCPEVLELTGADALRRLSLTLPSSMWQLIRLQHVASRCFVRGCATFVRFTASDGLRSPTDLSLTVASG